MHVEGEATDVALLEIGAMFYFLALNSGPVISGNDKSVYLPV